MTALYFYLLITVFMVVMNRFVMKGIFGSEKFFTNTWFGAIVCVLAGQAAIAAFFGFILFIVVYIPFLFGE